MHVLLTFLAIQPLLAYFDVDGNDAIIKAISTGYLVHIKGGHTTVGSSKELGIIESSAYPLDPDIYSNKETSAILIDGEGYYGQKGILTTSRESVWIQAPIINTSSEKGSLQASNTVNEGQEVCAYKDVLLYGNHTNIANTKIFANQDVDITWFKSMGDSPHLITHGSRVKANGLISIVTGRWHVDSHTTYWDYPSYTPRRPPELVTDKQSAQYDNTVRTTNGDCCIEFGRYFKYVAPQLFSKYNILAPHIYGLSIKSEVSHVPYRWDTKAFTVPQGSGGFGSFGGGSFSGSNFVGGSSGGGRFTSTYDTYQNRFNSTQNSSSLKLTNADMSWSSRGGNNFGASLNFTDSMGNSSTIGFKSYHGDLGSHTEFKSEFTPPNIYQQVRMGTMGIDPSKNSSALTLHNLCSMAILYGTAPKTLNNAAVKLAIAVAMQKVRQEVAIGVTSTVTGTILAKKGMDDAQKIFDKKTGLGSTTGMPDPDDEDENKKDKGKDKPTEKQRLKEAKLPTEGKIRFVPPENYNPTTPLIRGPNKGFMDKFGNEWVKGPSRTIGESFEWDVQLSGTGRSQLGWASRDGKHINVSLDGKITHM